MTARSFEQALSDSIEIEALAKKAGLDLIETRRILAALYDMEAPQCLRIMKVCHDDARRAQERARRLGR